MVRVALLLSLLLTGCASTETRPDGNPCLIRIVQEEKAWVVIPIRDPSPGSGFTPGNYSASALLNLTWYSENAQREQTKTYRMFIGPTDERVPIHVPFRPYAATAEWCVVLP